MYKEQSVLRLGRNATGPPSAWPNRQELGSQPAPAQDLCHSVPASTLSVRNSATFPLRAFPYGSRSPPQIGSHWGLANRGPSHIALGRHRYNTTAEIRSLLL